MKSLTSNYVTDLDGNGRRAKNESTIRSGRPRDPALDDLIVAATVRLLGEHGYSGVSVEAIAVAAGVTKPTIYRRWPTKAVLVADALGRRRRAMTTPGDHGGLRNDLLALVLDDHRALGTESGVILGVAFAARGDRDLDEEISHRVNQDNLTRIDAVLDRAVNRGELAPGAVDSTFLQRVIASLLVGLMFRAQPGEAEFLTQVVDDLLMPALLPARTAAPPTVVSETTDDQEHFR